LPVERALGVQAPGELRLFQVDEGPLRDGCFHVATVYSGLSAGTELTFVKGTNPYLHAHWDAELGCFRTDRSAVDYPVKRLGYMEVGRVTETRTSAVAPGALVAMAYGHQTGHLADALAERFVALPHGLDPVLGIYVAHMGPICANGLLHAAAEVAGRDVRDLGDGVRGLRVLVCGAGVIGLLIACWARHLGAAEVAVLDDTPDRRAVAEALELEALPAADAWRTLKRRWRHGAGDRGADIAFQCRGQVPAMVEALRCLRPQGTLIDLAFYQGGSEPLRLGEEFHHNGLGIRCAQIARVPRGLGHLWDRERLSSETIAFLGQHGESLRRHLISDVVPLDDAATLMADVASRRRHVLQAVFAGPAADGTVRLR
jgi:threonine dehydrogenase-like Zn-dependent dehydrogenase